MSGYNLPFEISESEHNEKKILSGLKKIEIYVSPKQVSDVLHSLTKLELEATLYDAQGLGKSTRKLSVGKSGGQFTTIPSDRKTIVTIAEAKIIEKLLEEIKHINDKSETKIGVISIQPVDVLLHL